MNTKSANSVSKIRSKIQKRLEETSDEKFKVRNSNKVKEYTRSKEKQLQKAQKIQKEVSEPESPDLEAELYE